MHLVDLHRHLEGAIRVSTVERRCRERGLDVPDLVVTRPLTLLDALKRFDGFRLAVEGPDDVVCIFREAIEDAVVEGLTALELRFSPFTLARSAGMGVAELVRLLDELAVESELPLSLVAIVSRGRGLEAAWDVVRALEKTAGCVAGVDFASDEVRVPTRAFAEVAAALASLGLPLTVHTGEGTPVAAVREALALPGVKRLGHALSLADDEVLAREVAARGIVVECCPTSNVRVGLATYADHPGRSLADWGVPLVLCTDDPTLFGIDLAHELDVARRLWGWSEARIAACMELAESARFR